MKESSYKEAGGWFQPVINIHTPLSPQVFLFVLLQPNDQKKHSYIEKIIRQAFDPLITPMTKRHLKLQSHAHHELPVSWFELS